jgi:hypothetical protein
MARKRIAWLEAPVWELEDGLEAEWTDEALIYLGNEDAKYILWSCTERGKWRTGVLCEEGLDVNEELACRTVIKCASKTQVINEDSI